MELLQIIPPLLVITILVFASYLFYAHYVVKAKGLSETLIWIKNIVHTIKSGDTDNRKTALTKVFQGTILEENWTEFARTLHEQKELVDGRMKVVKHRMTVPAHFFFTISTIIDRPLRVNYFKHLPGILTGVGIIGTFAGLLFGLSNFDVSSPEIINQSVDLLLAGVRDAFFASAFAITAAMIVTHVEKLLYQRCLIHLEELNETINRMFEGGVNEEYLSAIAKGASDPAQQAEMFRSCLVDAFEPMLKGMYDTQKGIAKTTRDSLFDALNESNAKLVSQLEMAFQRQLRASVDLMSSRLNKARADSENLDASRLKRIISAQKNDAAKKDDSSKVA